MSMSLETLRLLRQILGNVTINVDAADFVDIAPAVIRAKQELETEIAAHQ